MVAAALAVSSGVSAEGIYHPVAKVPRVSPYGDLSMMKHEGGALAAEMAAHCANVLGPLVVEGEDFRAAFLARRMLGLALLLDPGCVGAKATDAALAGGLRPPRLEGSYSGSLLAQILLTRGELLLEAGGESNREVAGYFLAVGAELDPRNEDAVYAWELYQLDAPPVDWTKLTGR
ncbi:hypothetical protein BH23VER1_BH23VER1_11020 [soil metagenome]